jgi:hypothetical protein
VGTRAAARTRTNALDEAATDQDAPTRRTWYGYRSGFTPSASCSATTRCTSARLRVRLLHSQMWFSKKPFVARAHTRVRCPTVARNSSQACHKRPGHVERRVHGDRGLVVRERVGKAPLQFVSEAAATWRWQAACAPRAHTCCPSCASRTRTRGRAASRAQSTRWPAQSRGAPETRCRRLGRVSTARRIAHTRRIPSNAAARHAAPHVGMFSTRSKHSSACRGASAAHRHSLGERAPDRARCVSVAPQSPARAAARDRQLEGGARCRAGKRWIGPRGSRGRWSHAHKQAGTGTQRRTRTPRIVPHKRLDTVQLAQQNPRLRACQQCCVRARAGAHVRGRRKRARA